MVAKTGQDQGLRQVTGKELVKSSQEQCNLLASNTSFLKQVVLICWLQFVAALPISSQTNRRAIVHNHEPNKALQHLYHSFQNSSIVHVWVIFLKFLKFNNKIWSYIKHKTKREPWRVQHINAQENNETFNTQNSGEVHSLTSQTKRVGQLKMGEKKRKKW